MEERKYGDCRDIDLDKIQAKGVANDAILRRAINMLKELKDIVDKLLFLKDSVKKIPKNLLNEINEYNSKIKQFVVQLEEPSIVGLPTGPVTKSQIIKQIINFYETSIGLNSSGKKTILELFSVVNSLDDSIEKQVSALLGSFNDFRNEFSSVDNTIADIQQKYREADNIIEELRKKASQQTVSDYAIVFGNEAKKYKEFALYWLTTGIIISIVFVLFMILSAVYKFLPSEVFSNAGDFVRYDFTNLASKIIIIAVIVFIMSFAFKQYSVNRHLQTLSQHRQNALNSYKLLTASIVGDDVNSRNALMVQIAKAIYEHSQSTGFLGSEKGQSVNSGIVELTKIIGENRTS